MEAGKAVRVKVAVPAGEARANGANSGSTATMSRGEELRAKYGDAATRSDRGRQNLEESRPVYSQKSAAVGVDRYLRRSEKAKSRQTPKISRGEELRAKYGDIGARVTAKSLAGQGSKKLERELASSSRNRQNLKALGNVRKEGALTRSEAGSKSLQKALDRRARKTGKDIQFSKKVVSDPTMKKTTDTFNNTFSGSSAKGGSAEQRQAGARRKAATQKQQISTPKAPQTTSTGKPKVLKARTNKKQAPKSLTAGQRKDAKERRNLNSSLRDFS